MSGPPSAADEPQGSRRRWRTAAALLAVAVVATLLVPVLGAPAAAQSTTTTNNSTNLSDTAPYYPNRTGNVSPIDDWLPNPTATIDAVGDLLVRIGPAFVGSGGRDRSGSGLVGVLLTGLVFAGGVTMAVGGIGLGPVGGVVVGLAMAYAMPVMGLAPMWTKPVILFLIAALAGLAALRAVNS